MDLKNDVHFRCWCDYEKELLKKAISPKDLLEVALLAVSRLSDKFHIVCGPITSGGQGNVDNNLLVFQAMIEMLWAKRNLNVFSQMPFEQQMVKFNKDWLKEHPYMTYCTPILDDFYAPFFKICAPRIEAAHFIHGWESSYGARWEHDRCLHFRIPTRDLTAADTIGALQFYAHAIMPVGRSLAGLV